MSFFLEVAVSEKDWIVLFMLGVPATISLIYALVLRYRDSRQRPDGTEPTQKN